MELAAGAVAVGGGQHRARARGRGPVSGRPRPISAQVEIVVPVYNEAHQLVERIETLRAYLNESLPFSALVTVVDNGSTDGTALVAQRLASTLEGVQAMILTRKGRGHALRCAWEASGAEVVAYMDVDLSTSLSALMPLLASVLSGHGDVAVGTRLGRGARVVRGPKRELISRGYSLLVRTSLRSRVSDFQCGFKALRRERALELLPLVEDEAWFFDTELVVTAERLGLRVTEIPVEWVDDPDSRVRIVSTAAADLRGVWRLSHGRSLREVRLRRAPAPPPAGVATADQLLSFAGVGLLSTLSYLLLFSLGWRALGPWLANALALAFCTVVNTALHRGTVQHSEAGEPSGAGPRPSFVTVATALFGVSLIATTAALALAHALGTTSLAAALVAVTLASGAASLVRFALLRGWAFRPGPPRP
jgi:putative flippase GtrA